MTFRFLQPWPAHCKEPRNRHRPSGRPSGAAIAPALLAGKEWVAIIETVPPAVFGRVPAAIQKTSLLVGVLAVLAAASLAVLLAQSLTRPIGRLTAAVKAIGSGRPAGIPVDASGETGVLARAFAQMVEETRAKTAALEREVREHRRTEAARSHHEARERLFSAAVESSDDAIVMQVARRHHYRLESGGRAPLWLFGDEAIGQSTSIIVPADRREQGKDYLARIAPGRADRTLRDRAPAQGRHAGRHLAQPLADQGAVGRDHRRLRHARAA